MATGKLGGKFLDDFQAWRDAKIVAQFPDIPNLSPDTLTVPNFLAISTFDPTTKIDIVKDRAQKYFVDILNYYNKFNPQPLSTEILELLQDEKTATFYQEYAQAWFLQVLYHTEEAAEYKPQVRCGIVETELDDLTLNSTMTKQTMMLYFIALKELVPQIIPYIYHHTTFNPKVRSFFLENMKAQDMSMNIVKSLVANIDKPGEFDQYTFMELRTKLDLLNPTYKLSNDILGTFVFTSFSFCISNGFKSSALTKAIYYQTILKVLKRIRKNPGNQFIDLVNGLITLFGNDILKASDNIAQLFFKVSLDLKKTLKNLNILTYVTKATVTPFKAATVGSTFDPLKSNPLFYKFLNGLLSGCQISTIAYSLYNYDNIGEFNVSLMYAGRGLYIYEYIDAVAANRIYPKMGEFIRDITRKMNPEAVAKAFQAMIPRIVEESHQPLITKIVPTIYVLTKDFETFTSFGNSKVQKRGVTVIPLNEIDSNFSVDLSALLLKSSFSGPSALYLGGTLLGLTLRKYLKDVLANTVKLIQMGKKFNPDMVDQITTFINVLPIPFRIDYDLEDESQMDWTIAWESLYDLSDQNVKRALDILSGVTI